MENSQFMIHKKGEPGVFYVQDLSFLDPFNYLKKPLIGLQRSLLRGDDPMEALGEFEKEIAAPAAQLELPMAAVKDAVESMEKGDNMEGVILRALADLYLPAAIDTQAVRMAEATGVAPTLFPKQKSPYHDERSIARELAGVFGMRVMKVDVKNDLRGKVLDYRAQYKEEFKNYKNTRDTNQAPMRQQAARKAALVAWRKANDELILTIERARGTGLDNNHIYASLLTTMKGTSSGLSKQTVRALLAGEHPKLPEGLFY
jgi:uncharacterized protein YhaN